MNPLARLMERIRRPVAADKVDAGAATIRSGRGRPFA